MFVRIARFQVDPSEIGTLLDAARENVVNARQAAAEGGGPEIDAAIGRLARRMQVLVDRRDGGALVVLYFDSEQDMQEADVVLNEMVPPEEYRGRRTGVEMLEVGIDETL